MMSSDPKLTASNVGEESPLATSSNLVSRNIKVNNRRTSVRLEPEMWRALHEISTREGCSIHDVCSLIAACKVENSSLTAAIRVFLMLYFRAATTEEGHARVGHGDFEGMKRRVRYPRKMPEQQNLAG